MKEEVHQGSWGQREVVDADAACWQERQVMDRPGKGSKVKDGRLCFALFQLMGGKGREVR